MSKLIIFDVCGTLTSLNSTHDFIKFLIKSWIKYKYKILLENRYIWYCCYIALKYIKIDLKRLLYISFFKWLNYSTIHELSIKYFNLFYKHTLYSDFIKVITDKQNSEDIILLSASINPPVEELSKFLNIKCYSSILDIKEWIYTWKLSLDLLWKKESIFKDFIKLKKNYTLIELYTDNEEDISLIDFLRSKEINLKIKIVVNNNKHYWDSYFSNKDLNYEYIYKI
jgi:phosphoserine phosphatase